MKVLVALSGGVDSSVAAALLLEGGLSVTGVTLRLFDACGEPSLRNCCGMEDALDARAVASALGIEHRVLEHQEAFGALVMDPFVRGYAAGRTPNPCILCNERIKFGTLWRYARENGFDALATGHHARISTRGGRADLRRGRDAAKDQSYVLFPLTREQRLSTLLPVGELTKGEVREKTLRLGLPTAGKAESQDVCFAPKKGYAKVVEERLGPQGPGPIRHVDGTLLGRHRGVHHFTVGQRRGLGVPWAYPLYVTAIDAATGEVTAGPRAALETRRFLVEGWRWHAPEGERPSEALVQVRYHQKARPAKLSETPAGLVVEWLAEGVGVTPGQAAVAYVDDFVAGGGWIRGILP